ncbi:hypothetical protein GCM10022631_02480 [Deinococcus rubellus]|uniref:Sensor domain-containing diguanylate cyclase n=1 Tax=Deinococcus rubellus TaxID=1889240 RepID=A0ABY5YI93_9DEIO|nr:sensor domain-containing diguanylate cyclase [Deinococcus rubellus]UWX64830.1 sensor domain-containing diguanylate cyclase [Deinococcus rubellus]
MTAEPPTTRGRLTLRRTYWLTLLLIGLLCVASNVLLSIQVQATASTTALINTYAPHSLSDLQAALTTFEDQHARLADPAPGLSASGFSPDIQRSYFTQTNTLLAQLPLQQPDVTLLPAPAREPLLKLLDLAISLDEHRSDRVIARVQGMSWLRVGAVLALLLGLGLYVFQPLERRNRELLTRLSAEHDVATQQASYAQALLRVSALSDSDLPLEQVAHELMAIVARTLGLDWAALGLMTEQGSQIAGVYAHPQLPAATLALLSQPARQGKGLTWDIIQGGKAVYVDDYTQLGQAQSALVAAGLRSLAWVPLNTFGQTQYVLSGARFSGQPWQVADRDLLEAAARTVTAAIDRRLYLHELRAEALTDVLTGLGNRRAFERDLRLAQVRASRHAQNLAVMMLDLDGLKGVNDQQGHERGDTLLRGFGHALAGLFRQSDRVYRLGGDEFAVLLPVTAPEHSSELLERVFRVVQPLHMQGFPGVGVSAGVALYPRDGLDAAALMRLADERMYECKRRHKAARTFPQ